VLLNSEKLVFQVDDHLWQRTARNYFASYGQCFVLGAKLAGGAFYRVGQGRIGTKMANTYVFFITILPGNNFTLNNETKPQR